MTGSDAMRAGSTIQIGVFALGAPFPAPTGIVDFCCGALPLTPECDGRLRKGKAEKTPCSQGFIDDRGGVWKNDWRRG
jgi:hypothetical protein